VAAVAAEPEVEAAATARAALPPVVGLSEEDLEAVGKMPDMGAADLEADMGEVDLKADTGEVDLEANMGEVDLEVAVGVKLEDLEVAVA
jgi:hypothetical protein